MYLLRSFRYVTAATDEHDCCASVDEVTYKPRDMPWKEWNTAELGGKGGARDLGRFFDKMMNFVTKAYKVM